MNIQSSASGNKGTDELIQRYINRGSFDLGNSWLASFEPFPELLSRKIRNRTSFTNCGGHLRTSIKKLSLYFTHFQEVSSISNSPTCDGYRVRVWTATIGYAANDFDLGFG